MAPCPAPHKPPRRRGTDPASERRLRRPLQPVEARHLRCRAGGDGPEKRGRSPRHQFGTATRKHAEGDTPLPARLPRQVHQGQRYELAGPEPHRSTRREFHGLFFRRKVDSGLDARPLKRQLPDLHRRARRGRVGGVEFCARQSREGEQGQQGRGLLGHEPGAEDFAHVGEGKPLRLWMFSPRGRRLAPPLFDVPPAIVPVHDRKDRQNDGHRRLCLCRLRRRQQVRDVGGDARVRGGQAWHGHRICQTQRPPCRYDHPVVLPKFAQVPKLDEQGF
mmetsp:Transcript_94673/g.267243  ORF Transcript_94673/g.267243 Transcript_94673/m.267243 type:complete len:276 (+) Transcript_94673:853-1680(+)